MVYLIALGQFAQTHILGIVIAILVSYGIGFMWHGPLFGKQWMALNNMKAPAKEDVKFSMMVPGLSTNLVLVVVESVVLGLVFQILGPANVGEAVFIAIVLWLPFSALLIVNIYAWGGKPVKLMLLDSGHALVSVCAVAAVVFGTL
jgi:hypothetical protein